MFRWLAFFCAITSFLCAATSTQAETRSYGPFSVNDAAPDVIALDGQIDAGSALAFRRALEAAPKARLVTLNSPGGTVQMGLLIADDIHQKKLSTLIPKGKGCYSACAFIFFAGVERQIDGELGVHQMSGDKPDDVGTQMTVSDVIDVLNRFDTPVEVMSIMFRTPPADMHVFTADEIQRLQLNRRAPSSSPQETATTQGATVTPEPSASATSSKPVASDTPKPETATAYAAPARSTSAIDEFTKRPNRIAVYTGLDFLGDDIDAVRAADAGECANRCFTLNGQCKAFTFNTNPKIVKGPNCFLKSSIGRADGNSIAFSGRLLSGAENDPEAFNMGVIDPKTALFDNVDVPGGDLSRRPHPHAHTPLDCRLACIDETTCIGFSYIRAKKECWLKGALGQLVMKKGVISGMKTMQTFAPAKVISLE